MRSDTSGLVPRTKEKYTAAYAGCGECVLSHSIYKEMKQKSARPHSSFNFPSGFSLHCVCRGPGNGLISRVFASQWIRTRLSEASHIRRFRGRVGTVPSSRIDLEKKHGSLSPNQQPRCNVVFSDLMLTLGLPHRPGFQAQLLGNEETELPEEEEEE